MREASGDEKMSVTRHFKLKKEILKIAQYKFIAVDRKQNLVGFSSKIGLTVSLVEEKRENYVRKLVIYRSQLC